MMRHLSAIAASITVKSLSLGSAPRLALRLVPPCDLLILAIPAAGRQSEGRVQMFAPPLSGISLKQMSVQMSSRSMNYKKSRPIRGIRPTFCADRSRRESDIGRIALIRQVSDAERVRQRDGCPGFVVAVAGLAICALTGGLSGGRTDLLRHSTVRDAAPRQLFGRD